MDVDGVPQTAGAECILPLGAKVVFARTDQHGHLQRWFGLQIAETAEPPPRERGERGRGAGAKARQEEARKGRKRKAFEVEAEEAEAASGALPEGSAPEARAARRVARLNELLSQGRIKANGFAFEMGKVSADLAQQLRMGSKKQRVKQNKRKRKQRQADQRQRGAGAARARPAPYCRWGDACRNSRCPANRGSGGGGGGRRGGGLGPLRARRPDHHYN